MFDFFKKKKPEIEEEQQVVTKEYFDDIEAIANYFHNETGITFDSQISILKSKVTSFCRQRDIYSFSSLLQTIQSSQKLKQELIDYLTTNETFFYREFKQIEELVELVKKEDRQITILCAPCATGEEPYSIVLALLEAGVSYGSFKVLGIDINSDAISKAQEAIYRERNLRNLSPAIISKYFVHDNLKYSLNEKVKSLVSFKITNLFDDSFKKIGKFDFVFSRNMFIYFDKETKIKAKVILESVRKSNKYDVFFGHADLF